MRAKANQSSVCLLGGGTSEQESNHSDRVSDIKKDIFTAGL